MPSIQVKALFILALLGGHEAVRIHEGVNLTALSDEFTGHLKPGKDEKTYQEMNKKCKSSWDRKCTQEGCEWKPFTLDGPWGSCRKSDESLLASGPEAVKEHLKMFAGILKAKAKKYTDSCSGRLVNKLKCKRRIQQMVNSVRFMALARKKAGEFSEEDREEIKQVFEEARDSIAATMENGDSAKKLQDKILSSHAMEANPSGTVKTMVDTVMKVTEGSKEQQEEAKELIDRTDAFEPIEEESDSIEKENEETDDDFDESLRQVEPGSEDETEETEETDEIDEEKPSSALQVRNSLQIDRSDVAGALLAVLAVGAVVFTVTMVGQILAFALLGYALVLLVGCIGYYIGYYARPHDEANALEAQKDGGNETQKDQQVAKSNNGKTEWKAFKGAGKCFVKRFLFPFRMMYKAGKWAYEAAFKKDNSTTTTKAL